MGKVLVTCTKRYNGEELWTLLGVLQERGHEFEVVSQDTTIMVERTKYSNTIERLISDVSPEEIRAFDALVAVCGHPDDTAAFWEDAHLHDLLRAAQEAGVVLGGICMSVPALAPILKGVKVSAFPLMRSKERLRIAGAIHQNLGLTVDVEHRVVTAENRIYHTEWAEEICNMIEGKPPQYELVECGFDPRGLERLMLPEVREAIDESRGYKMVMRKQKKDST